MNTSYKPFAYYSENDSGEELITAFPYFFVTEAYVVQISGDLNRAFIINDIEYVQEYHRHCQRLMSLSVEMLNTPTPREKFNIFFNSAPLLYQTIEYQPSLTQYFTFEIIKKYLPDTPEKDIFLSRSIDLIEMSTHRGMRFQGKCVYFSEKGLKYFADTGILTSIPGKLLSRISIVDRIHLLTQLKHEIGTYLKMLKPSVLNVPLGFSILSFTDNTILITYLTDSIDYVCSLKESSICMSIGQFIESFDEEDKCYPTDHALKIIDEQITKLKQKSKQAP